MNAQKTHKWIGELTEWALSIKSLPVLLSLLLLTAASCTKELPPESASHTVIFYLGGNNNLSASIASQLAELQEGYTAFTAGSSSVSANVFVYAARPSGASLQRLAVDAPPRIIDGFGQSDSSDPATLARVIDACRHAAPAKTYTLVVASHASGWLPAGTLHNPQLAQLSQSGTTGSPQAVSPSQPGTLRSPPHSPCEVPQNQRLPPTGRSIIRDESSPTGEMELAAFAAAIPDGVFDAIVLEACLMGGVEVAYALRDKARYLLAAPAELLDPGFTPIYRNALRTLCGAGVEPPARLIAFAREYMTYINQFSGNHRSATLSVIDLGQMEPLAGAFARCCEGGFSVASQQQLATVQRFDRPGRYGDNPALARFFDLEDAVSHLAGGAEEVDELTRALARAVIWKASTAAFMPSIGGFTIESYCGLTTYIPRIELPALNAAYRSTAWWQRTIKNNNPQKTK